MRPFERTIRLLKMSLAAGLSWYLASLVSPHENPYFAPLAAVIIFQTTVADTVAKAWHRIAGIVGGVAVCLFISQWLQVGAVTIGLAVLIGAVICTTLRLDPQITSQVGVTVVMVLASSGTPHYAEYRILESLLGAVVAVVVNAVLLPPNGLPLAERAVLEVAEMLSFGLLDLSRGPEGSQGLSVKAIARQIERQTGSAFQALRTAEISHRLNPFVQTGRARLGQLTTAMGELEKIGVQVRGIARGLEDLGPRIDSCRADLNNSLSDTAECVAAFRRAVESPSDETLRMVQVALAQAQSSQARCLTHLRETPSLADVRDLSAVLADLDRILAEVTMYLRNHIGQRAVQQSVAFGDD